jgi:hypothetical protein
MKNQKNVFMTSKFFILINLLYVYFVNALQHIRAVTVSKRWLLSRQVEPRFAKTHLSPNASYRPQAVVNRHISSKELNSRAILLISTSQMTGKSEKKIENSRHLQLHLLNIQVRRLYHPPDLPLMSDLFCMCEHEVKTKAK